jgi:hypothetical protein
MSQPTGSNAGTYPTLPERVVIDLWMARGVHMLCAIGPRLLSTAQRDGQRGEAMGGTGHTHQRAAAWCGNWKVPLYPCTSVSPVYRLGSTCLHVG